MRICLLAWGTRGDVQPVVALGRGLKSAGHEVTVAAVPSHTPMITTAGLTADPFGLEVEQVFPLANGPNQRRTGRRSRVQEARAELRLFREAGNVFAVDVADHVARLSARHDAFLSGVMTFDAMLPAARAADKPHAMLALAPGAPTRSGAATPLPLRPDADSILNLLAGWFRLYMSHAVLRRSVVETCARLGLPRQTMRRHVGDVARTPQLLGASPHVVPRPVDWPDRVLTTGYWVDPHDPSYAPPADLADFLAAGPPPVYVGFGSMPSYDPAALVDLVVAALRRAGRRGLIHGNWYDWRPEALPDDVHHVDDVPHDWLFPRTAGVVHHGGAGTTAAAVRAGVPQFVVPHFVDQPYWGRRVAHLGLGPPPVRRRDLNPANLAAAVTRLTQDPGFRTRAAALRATVRAEDGVTAAVTAIQRMLSTTR